MDVVRRELDQICHVSKTQKPQSIHFALSRLMLSRAILILISIYVFLLFREGFLKIDAYTTFDGKSGGKEDGSEF